MLEVVSPISPVPHPLPASFPGLRHVQRFPGIQFVKRLQKLNDPNKQRAEVAVYFQKFDEAEGLYREMDRVDLAIELRMRLGDWFRVLQLAQGSAGDDELRQLAWNKIGDYYSDRQMWNKAVQYYTQARNAEALVNCFYMLEDFEGLEKLVDMLPDASPLLMDVGHKLQSVCALQPLHAPLPSSFDPLTSPTPWHCPPFGRLAWWRARCGPSLKAQM